MRIRILSSGIGSEHTISAREARPALSVALLRWLSRARY